MRQNPRPNIIVLMLDTFRADYLSDYGGPSNLKNIESLAKEAIVYRRAIAPGTYTAPSHASLFLRKRVKDIPSVIEGHRRKLAGESSKLPKYIAEGEKTLARKLSMKGYKTALFSSNPIISSYTNFSEGFLYSKLTENEEKKVSSKFNVNTFVENRRFLDLMRIGAKLVPGAVIDSLFVKFVKRLEKRLDVQTGVVKLDQGASLLNSLVDNYLNSVDCADRNFIFINYMEAHEPYPVSLVSKKEVRQSRWLYLGGLADLSDVNLLRQSCGRRIEYLDSKIGELLEILKRRGFMDNAIVIVISDHGQAFMEHGQMYHDVHPYREIVEVPLIIARFRKGKPLRTKIVVDETVSLVDLHDMIMQYSRGRVKTWKTRGDNLVFSDHIGLARWWGSEVVENLKDASNGFRSIYKKTELFDRKSIAVYYKNYKLIHYLGHESNDELYEIGKDVNEINNIAVSKEELCRKIKKMAGFI